MQLNIRKSDLYDNLTEFNQFKCILIHSPSYRRPDVWRQNSSDQFAKSYVLKSSPKHSCYMTNTVPDVYLFSPVFTQFTYFPQDVSEIHTSFHSTELQLILRSDIPMFCTRHVQEHRKPLTDIDPIVTEAASSRSTQATCRAQRGILSILVHDKIYDVVANDVIVAWTTVDWLPSR